MVSQGAKDLAAASFAEPTRIICAEFTQGDATAISADIKGRCSECGQSQTLACKGNLRATNQADQPHPELGHSKGLSFEPGMLSLIAPAISDQQKRGKLVSLLNQFTLNTVADKNSGATKASTAELHTFVKEEWELLSRLWVEIRSGGEQRQKPVPSQPGTVNNNTETGQPVVVQQREQGQNQVAHCIQCGAWFNRLKLTIENQDITSDVSQAAELREADILRSEKQQHKMADEVIPGCPSKEELLLAKELQSIPNDAKTLLGKANDAVTSIDSIISSFETITSDATIAKIKFDEKQADTSPGALVNSIKAAQSKIDEAKNQASDAKTKADAAVQSADTVTADTIAVVKQKIESVRSVLSTAQTAIVDAAKQIYENVAKVVDEMIDIMDIAIKTMDQRYEPLPATLGRKVLGPLKSWISDAKKVLEESKNEQLAITTTSSSLKARTAPTTATDKITTLATQFESIIDKNASIQDLKEKMLKKCAEIEKDLPPPPPAPASTQNLPPSNNMLPQAVSSSKNPSTTPVSRDDPRDIELQFTENGLPIPQNPTPSSKVPSTDKMPSSEKQQNTGADTTAKTSTVQPNPALATNVQKMSALADDLRSTLETERPKEGQAPKTLPERVDSLERVVYKVADTVVVMADAVVTLTEVVKDMAKTQEELKQKMVSREELQQMLKQAMDQQTKDLNEAWGKTLATTIKQSQEDILKKFAGRSTAGGPFSPAKEGVFRLKGQRPADE